MVAIIVYIAGVLVTVCIVAACSVYDWDNKQWQRSVPRLDACLNVLGWFGIGMFWPVIVGVFCLPVLAVIFVVLPWSAWRERRERRNALRPAAHP